MYKKLFEDRANTNQALTWLENSTRPLIFTSTKGSRTSENFEFSSENQILPIYANNFCDAGQVSIFRYFEACLMCEPKIIFSYFSTKTYVVGTQKNRLLSTQNVCLMGTKY